MLRRDKDTDAYGLMVKTAAIRIFQENKMNAYVQN
jgi:hypothetical protein